MAQTNYTPISLYYSTTASAVPTAANLVPGELAINTNDGKLYYEDSSGVVQVLATKSTGSIGGSNTQVQFNNSGSLGGSSSFTWDGTTVTATKFAGALNGTVGATTASTGAFTTLSTSSTTTLSGLTASTALALDASKNVVSVTNTGTGNNVLSASPTLTGTIAGASLSLSSLTSGRVTYATTAGLLTDSANMTFNGTTLTLANDASISGLTVGKGAGSITSNTVLGRSAFTANSTGSGVTAIGNGSLAASTANNNTAVGDSTAALTTTGTANSAFGAASLYFNTTGSYNTAYGQESLFKNTTASNNTAVGYQAGYTNTTGIRNVYIGNLTGYTATSDYNTMVGSQAGQLTTTGTLNTFIGVGSGSQITTGSKNSILGGFGGNSSGLDIRTSSNYIVLADGDGNPCIVTKYGVGTYLYGNIGTGAGSNAVKYNTTTKELTYDTSSARYKDNIRDSVYGLNAVMALRSTMFEYKKEQRTDVGLIAEEVDLVIPELVGKNADGQPDSVTYDRMVSVLVKAIQEQQAIIESLKARLDAANL